jgi:hypothetical protein
MFSDVVGAHPSKATLPANIRQGWKRRDGAKLSSLFVNCKLRVKRFCCSGFSNRNATSRFDLFNTKLKFLYLDFETLHFLRNLRKGVISLSVCPWQALSSLV